MKPAFRHLCPYLFTAALLLPQAPFAAPAQEGQLLGDEIVREYNKDTTNPDLVKDINNLLDSLKNENQLSPETKEILRKMSADSLPSTVEALTPQNNVEIEKGDLTTNVFDDFKKLDKNINTRGDVGMGMETKEAEDSPDMMIEQAYRAMEAGQLEVAASYYKRALYQEPENTQALFGLAAVYQRTGQLPQARATYSKLLSIDPDNWAAMNNFLILAAEEAPDHAVEEFRRLQQANPEFAPIPAQIGMIYYRNKKYDNAADYLQKAIQLDPANLSYRFNLAVIYDKLGRTKLAARLYQQLLAEGQKGRELPETMEKIQERLAYIRSNDAAYKYN